MLRKIMLATALLPLAAATVAQDAADGYRPDKSATIPLAETALLAQLKDPGSAQFTWPYDFRYGTFRLQHSVQGWITCGTLNAKNSFGGYVGAQPTLVVVKGGAVAVALVDSPRFHILGRQCAQMGMPVG
jgi:hypothetical protein